jgi:NDP-sugar pyrophosphorylase family protein
MRIDAFISMFAQTFPAQADMSPWDFVRALPQIITAMLPTLSDDFAIKDDIAIHKTAIIEKGAIIKGPAIICAHCFVASHAYLREGVYLGSHTKVGPGCEIKSSVVMSQSSIAHFNFIGDSIIGTGVNFEAGAVIANHYNEREDKMIRVKYNGQIIDTHCVKFGALVGDHTKVGANAVLSPGTLLPTHSVVRRLELIEQV